MDMEERQGRQGNIDHKPVQNGRCGFGKTSGAPQKHPQQETACQQNEVDHVVPPFIEVSA
jgi:hypothetical protein